MLSVIWWWTAGRQPVWGRGIRWPRLKVLQVPGEGVLPMNTYVAISVRRIHDDEPGGAVSLQMCFPCKVGRYAVGR